MTNFWTDKRVVITGAGGFLGSHLLDALQPLGAAIYAPRQSTYDLRCPTQCLGMLRHARSQLDGDIDILFNLAANVGGIGYNANHPYSLFYDNMLIGLNVINSGLHRVKKLVQVGTVCAYPKFARPPFREEMLWDGYPEETNAPYGLAKKMALVQLQAARAEYGLNGIYILPTNLYGPRDEFDPARSHVIPALIRKCIEARDTGQVVKIWGTGSASRDFLYVTDAARALLLAAEHYDSPAPLNVGSGAEIRITALAYLIQELTGHTGGVEWDRSKPDGQPRRGLNISLAKQALGWEPVTSLRDGLTKTIEWYEQQQVKEGVAV